MSNQSIDPEYEKARMSLAATFLNNLNGLPGPVPMKDFLYSTNISLKHNYIYVETPKVACTNIKRFLIDAELDTKIIYSNLEEIHVREFSPLLNPMQIRNFLNLTKSNFFVFCFVRNPYTRLLSAYLDKIARKRYQSELIRAKLGADIATNNVISFADFVSAINNEKIEEMDPHWRPQYYQTFHPYMKYTFIGRLETFEHDLKEVCDRIGIDFAKYYSYCSSSKNEYTSNTESLMTKFYTRQLQKLVAQIYKIDFEYFGYSI